MQIMLTVNGEHEAFPEGVGAIDILSHLGVSGEGIAIAVNGQVCPRRDWYTALSDGAVVEVLTAVQGG